MTANRAELQEQVDALATRLVVDGVAGDLAEAWAQLSRSALGSGCPQTAGIAAELAETTKAAPPELEQALRDGLGRLQEALAQEARPAAEPSAAAPAATSNSLAQDPELVRDFIVEAREHLTSIESKMLVLEQNPGDTEAIHSVFRGFHTIKGLAGFLEFAVIQEVAHEVETLLDRARNGKLVITSAVVDEVLASADFLKQVIDGVEAGMSGPTPPLADHRELLKQIRQRTVEGAGSAEAAAPEAAAPPAAREGISEPVAPPPPPAVPAAETASREARAAAPVRAPESFSVRVETGKLDYLLDMVGEMVIAQSLIRHNSSLATIQDSRLQGDLSQLARITSEVQRATMSMRMIPIGQLFQRTSRLVRDLSRKAGKQVELETSGEDTSSTRPSPRNWPIH